MKGLFEELEPQSNSSYLLLWRPMQYRCEATSVEGFVQQIACSYLRHGYWWYVTGVIPKGKDAGAVDEKLMAKYFLDHRFDLAIKEYERMEPGKIDDLRIHFMAGIAYKNLGELEKSVETLKKSLSEDPECEMCQHYLEKASLKLEDERRIRAQEFGFMFFLIVGFLLLAYTRSWI